MVLESVVYKLVSRGFEAVPLVSGIQSKNYAMHAALCLHFGFSIANMKRWKPKLDWPSISSEELMPPYGTAPYNFVSSSHYDVQVKAPEVQAGPSRH